MSEALTACTGDQISSALVYVEAGWWHSTEQSPQWSAVVRKAIGKRFLNAFKVSHIKGEEGKKD